MDALRSQKTYIPNCFNSDRRRNTKSNPRLMHLLRRQYNVAERQPRRPRVSSLLLGRRFTDHQHRRDRPLGHPFGVVAQ
jgi:hypothetical protein